MIEMDFKIALPPVVEAAIARYREENDWLNHFLTECCEVNGEYSARSGQVFQAYRNYCADTSEFFRSTAEFYAALDTAGFRRKHTNTGSIIYGLRLKTAEFGDFLK